MKKQTAATKICICLLTAAVIFSAALGTEKTGAWFTDSGTWLEAEYGVGVIDYIVYMNGENIEKIKNGQQVSVSVPIAGAAKLNDGEKPVAAVRSQASGTVIGAHDEFDEGVTLVRARIVNTGGLPVGIRATVTAPQPADSGMLSMVIPADAWAEPENFCVRGADGAGTNYRQYIRGKLTGAYGDFAALSAALDEYHSKITNGVTNNTVVYPGKLPPWREGETAKAFEIDVLCWAEYDQMPWNGDSARDNGKALEQREGRLIFTINCTL